MPKADTITSAPGFLHDHPEVLAFIGTSDYQARKDLIAAVSQRARLQ